MTQADSFPLKGWGFRPMPAQQKPKRKNTPKGANMAKLIKYVTENQPCTTEQIAKCTGVDRSYILTAVKRKLDVFKLDYKSIDGRRLVLISLQRYEER